MKKLIHFGHMAQVLSTIAAQIGIVLAFTCAFAMDLKAQAPKISMQGTLKTSDGSTVPDGPQNVTFKLYTTETGGTAIWQEDAMVDVIGGIYSHYLGSVTPLNGQDFAVTLYLGITVSGYELVPRTEMSYSPYSFTVAKAQTVVCSGAVGDVKYSILDPVNFAKENGTCWVPLKGGSLAPTDKLRSAYGITNLPDAGGLFVRAQEFSGGADQDPDRNSNSPIGSYEGDGLASHNHNVQGTTSNDGNHSHNVPLNYYGNDGGTSGAYQYANQGPGTSKQTDSAGSHTHTFNVNSSNTGTNETRPKNLNLWMYIRIN